MAQTTLSRFHRSRFRPVWAFLAAGLLVALGLGGVYAYRVAVRWHHLQAAAEARGRKDYAQEHAHLLACLRAGDARPETYLEAARSARHLRDFDEAQRLLKQCEALRGQQPDPAVNLERLLLGVQSGNLSYTDPNIPECVRQVPEGDPAAAELLELVSERYIRDYMLGQARDTLTLWVERDPTNVTPLLRRGWITGQLNSNFLPAVPDFQKAVELEPNNHLARLLLAEAHLTGRQAEQALPQLEAVQQQRPDDLLMLYYMAFCRLDLGEPQEAKEVLDRLLLPERLALVEKLAACQHAGHPVPKEVENAPWYQELMTEVPFGARGEPDNIITLFVRGLVERARAARATDEDGEPFLREAVKLDPFDYDPEYQLVVHLEGHGKAREAKPYRERMTAIRKDLDLIRDAATQILARPADPEPRCAVAEIRLRLQQPGQARLWLNSALRVSPNYPRALRLLDECDRRKRAPAAGCSAGGSPAAAAGALGKPGA